MYRDRFVHVRQTCVTQFVRVLVKWQSSESGVNAETFLLMSISNSLCLPIQINTLCCLCFIHQSLSYYSEAFSGTSSFGKYSSDCKLYVCSQKSSPGRPFLDNRKHCAPNDIKCFCLLLKAFGVCMCIKMLFFCVSFRRIWYLKPDKTLDTTASYAICLWKKEKRW